MSSLPIGEDVALSSRRCAGARFLYTDVTRDPLAPVLAGEDIIESERVNMEKNAVYPVVAVRTRWMDDRIAEAIAKDPAISQVGGGGVMTGSRNTCVRTGEFSRGRPIWRDGALTVKS
jgi:hypothetical protein